MSNEIERIDSNNQFHPQSQLDDALEKEIADALGGESLDDIMDSADAGLVARRVTADGQRLFKSKVIDIHGDSIFVDLGGKTQGLLSTTQFGDDDGQKPRFQIAQRPDMFSPLAQPPAVLAPAVAVLVSPPARLVFDSFDQKRQPVAMADQVLERFGRVADDRFLVVGLTFENFRQTLESECLQI